MATDNLTVERLRELLTYDPETGIFTRRLSRGKAKAGTTAGSIYNKGYLRICVDGCDYLAHRLAWMYMTGMWPTDQIDHVNGVRTDNSICNLREATNSENQHNQQKARSNNKSCGLLGVTPDGRQWKATITFNSNPHYLGCYDTPELAHAAYLAAKRDLHKFGEIAKTAPDGPKRRAFTDRSASRLTGVYRSQSRWAARITVGGKQRHIGVYDTKDLAHNAYVEAKNKMHDGFTT